MKLRVVVALGLSSVLAPARAGAAEQPEVLGLREVLERVRANNAALEAVRAGVRVADAEVRRAWTGWQPNLSVIGQLTLNSVESKLDLASSYPPALLMMFPPDVQEAILSTEPQVIQAHVQWAGALSLSQTLFNIAVLRAPGAAKVSRRAAVAQVDATEDDLLFSAATMYTTIRGLTAMESAAGRAIAVAEQRVKDARLQVEAGTQTTLTLTRAETDRVVAEGERTALRSQRLGMLANLAALIGAGGKLELRDEHPLDHVEPQREGGVDGRSSILARQAALDAAEARIGLFDLAWLPTLTADGQVRWTSVSGFAGDDLLATATINLVLPIYDQGVRYADKDLAEAQVAVARAQLEQERRTARAFLEEARATLESAQAALDSARAQLELATQAVKQAEDLVAHGLATNLELSDADSRRYTADRTVVQRQLEVDLAGLRAHYAAGGRLLEVGRAE